SSPGGAATVAVLVNDTSAPGSIWATAVNVTVPPGSSVTVVTMLPVPLAAATLDPADGTAVQLTAVIGDGVGNRSVTCWSTAVLGPLFVTTIVYVVLVPGTAVRTPSVLVMDRSAWGVRPSVSVALLSVGSGSVTPAGAVTVAVLTREPVAEGLTWTVKVN